MRNAINAVITGVVADISVEFVTLVNIIPVDLMILFRAIPVNPIRLNGSHRLFFGTIGR
jgi:hypothetical protein